MKLYLWMDCEGAANVFGLEQRAEITDAGETLAEELISQAALAELVFGMFGIGGTHVAAEGLGDFVVMERANLLFVIFAVEEIGVDPLAAAQEKAAAFGSEIGFTDDASHFFTGAQGTEIVNCRRAGWGRRIQRHMYCAGRLP